MCSSFFYILLELCQSIPPPLLLERLPVKCLPLSRWWLLHKVSHSMCTVLPCGLLSASFLCITARRGWWQQNTPWGLIIQQGSKPRSIHCMESLPCRGHCKQPSFCDCILRSSISCMSFKTLWNCISYQLPNFLKTHEDFCIHSNTHTFHIRHGAEFKNELQICLTIANLSIQMNRNQ